MKLSNLWRTATNWLRRALHRAPARPKWLDDLTDDELSAMRTAFALVHQRLGNPNQSGLAYPFVCHMLNDLARWSDVSFDVAQLCKALVRQQLDGWGTYEGYLCSAGDPRVYPNMSARSGLSFELRREWIERTLMPMLWRKQ